MGVGFHLVEAFGSAHKLEPDRYIVRY